MKRIAYYVTGHGFGHATRTGAAVAQLLEAEKGRLIVHLVTDVPPWIFKDLSGREDSYRIRSRQNDVGLVQKDGLHIDYEASASALAAFLRRFDAEAIEEARFLERERIDLVLSDIPALPFAAARRAGVPSIGVSNFSWDVIYRPYVAKDPVFAEAVARFEDAYRGSTALFRLPFATPMDAFSNPEDVPLLVRLAKTPREQMRRALGLESDPRPIVLICFGGLGLTALDPQRLFDDDSRIILIFGSDPDPKPSFGHVRFVANDRFYFPDLVEAADVLVSKPGYGLVGEAIAHQTPFLYVPREDFAESPYLVRALAAHVRSAPTSLESLGNGRFLEEAAALIGPKAHPCPIATDGARVIAERIWKRLS
jgi:L-arabinokinase